MDPKKVDDRSPFAQAFSTANQITGISLMMVVPAIVGHFVDQYLGTVFLFLVLGFVIGGVSSVFQLMKLVRVVEEADSKDLDD